MAKVRDAKQYLHPGGARVDRPVHPEFVRNRHKRGPQCVKVRASFRTKGDAGKEPRRRRVIKLRAVGDIAPLFRHKARNSSNNPAPGRAGHSQDEGGHPQDFPGNTVGGADTMQVH